MAKDKGQTTLATAPKGGGALVAHERSGSGAVVHGRDAAKAVSQVVLYQGTSTEEELYGKHARGLFLDALEKRPLGMTVQIIPVAGWMSWSRFEQGQVAPVYSFTDVSKVPADDLRWTEEGMKRNPPLAVECVNLICVVNDEPWPCLVRFKRTSLKAYQRTIEPLEARHGHCLYELGSVPDKNASGQNYRRMTAKLVRRSNDEELALVDKIKSVLSEVRAKAEAATAEREEIPI